MSYFGGIMVALAIVLAGLYFAYRFFREAKRQFESRNWHTTTGTVTDFRVRSKEVDVDEAIIYIGIFAYEYEVLGRTYEGRMEAGGFSGSEDSIRNRGEKYPVGSRVTVYYDPVNPKNSTLERGVKGRTILSLVASLFIILMGILCAFSVFAGDF